MSTFDPMKARTPGSQTTVTGPTKGKDPAGSLSRERMDAIRRRATTSKKIEYKHLPSGSTLTPRYRYTRNRFGGSSMYDYYFTKDGRRRGGRGPLTPATARMLREESMGRPATQQELVQWNQERPYTIPDSEKYLGSFDMYAFVDGPRTPTRDEEGNIVVSGAAARLADVRRFIDTKGSAFDLRQNDAEKMIRQGLMAYVTRKGSDFPEPILVANPIAVQNFLRTNYREKKPKAKEEPIDRNRIEYERKAPDYVFDDRFEYYLNLRGLNPRSTAFLYDTEKEKNVKRVVTKDKIPYVEKSTDPSKPDAIKMRTVSLADYQFDFEAMANKYKKFTEADAKWRGKIVQEINRKGGERGLGLFAKFIAGEANNDELDELKQYMFSFSPQGTYADVQKTFIADNQGINFSDIARSIEEGEKQKVRAAQATKQRMKDEAERRFRQEEVRLEFFTETNPEEDYNNFRNLILEGRSEDIPADVIRRIQKTINESTGDETRTSARTSEALGLEDSRFGRVADILSGGQTIGAEVNKRTEELRNAEYQRDALKVDFINLVNKALVAKTEMSPEVAALANEFMNDLGTERYNQVSGNFEEYITMQQQFPAYALGKLAEVAEAGPLSPTSAEDIRNNMNAYQATQEVQRNFAKGIVRTTAALPYGLYSIATDPGAALEAIKDDYTYRYSSVDGFIDSSLEDPLAPILDLLAMVPVAGWAAKGTQVAKVLAMTTKAGRAGLTAKQFAKMQRQVMVGTSPNAEAVLRAVMSEGEFGSLNQLYSRGNIDRAATFFEPRYVVVNARDGIPQKDVADTVDALSQRFAAEAKEKVYFRMAGNPASRGFQNLTLAFQKKTGRMGINLPLLGFQYRYGKAMREGNPIVSDMAAREFIVERQLQRIQELGLDDAEQMAAWAAAGGNGQGYAAFIAVQNRRLVEAEKRAEEFGAEGRAGGEEVRLLEIDYNRHLNPEFQRRYRDALASMLDVDEFGVPRTERGRKVSKMRDAMILLSERNNRVLKGEADPRTLAAFRRTYAYVLTASKLTADDIVSELGANGANVLLPGRAPVLNPNFRIPELLNADARQLPNARGDVVDINAKGVAEFMDEVNDGFARMKRDMATRDISGNPVVFIDDTIKPVDVPTVQGTRLDDVTLVNERVTSPEPVRTMRYYPARYVRVEGRFDDLDMSFERSPLLSDDIVWIPEWAIATSRKGNPKFKSPAEAQIDVEVAVVNKMNKLFPNARDFSDKISTRAVRGPESFAAKQNRNEVVASGLASYQFDVQLAASVAATQRRVQTMFADIINETAVPITIAEYQANHGAYVPVSTIKLFDNEPAAQAYASQRRHGDLEAQEQGTVEPIEINGQTYYKTNMNFFDAMSTVMAESRLQRLADWEQDISRMFIDENIMRLLDPAAIKNLDAGQLAARYQELGLGSPDSLIMVIPKGINDRFGQVSRRSNKLGMQVLYGLTDIFKTFVLAISPRFISQQVVGTSTLLMLGRPEWAPAVMASLLAKGAQNAVREGTLRGRRERRTRDQGMVDLAQLGDDYMILREIFADDFSTNQNIFRQDMSARNQRLERAATGIESRLPGVGKVARPLLTNRAAKVGGRFANTLASFGYIIAFAFESAMRAAIMRHAATRDPAFKALMNSKVVDDFMGTPVPGQMIGKQTRFHAAMRLIADPNSEFYNPFMLREMRYQADTIVGNYRWFTPAEKTIRDFLLPFYAWTRHSALFTKRLVQDRPISANFYYNAGNYGYAEQLEAGGLPDWLIESIPMPSTVVNLLKLDPTKLHFLGAQSVNPMGETGKNVAKVMGVLPGFLGGVDMGERGELRDGLNPYITGLYARDYNLNALTGIPDTRSKDATLLDYYINMYKSFPMVAAQINLFKTEMDLNEARNMYNPEDIFVNPNDMENSKLRKVPDRLSTRYPTMTPAGLFNVFNFSRVHTLDPQQLDRAVEMEWKNAGIIVDEERKAFKSQATRAAENLREWKELRDFVMNYWMPKNAKDNPEMATLVLKALRNQYPSSRQLKGLSNAQINAILGGGGPM